MTGIESTINLVEGAFKAATDVIAPFVESAADSEVAVTKLETVLKSTGGAFNFTSQQLQDMATNMQNLSGYSDEAEMSAEAMLLRFENLNGIFPQALQLTNDLARSLGMDLTTAAQTIGKALDDPASGIGRLNMQFKLFNDTEMETIKNMAANGDVAGAQALIMERLQEKVGGAADAYGKTFSGALDIAKEKLDNVKEQIGGAMLPTLTTLLEKFQLFLDDPAVQQFLDNATRQIEKFGLGLQYFITDQLPQLLQQIKTEGFLSVADNFVGNLIDSISNKIDLWVAGDGPQKLTDKVISWINTIGTGADFDSKTLAAMQRLFDSLSKAVGGIDWGKIANTIDNVIASNITAHDWKSSGDAFGAAVEKFVTDGWGKGVSSPTVQSDAIQALGAAIKSWFQGAVGDVYFQHSAQDIAAAFVNVFIDTVKTNFMTSIHWTQDVAANIVNSFLTAIKTNFMTSVNWVADLFETYIIDPVKRVFGISSPSTVFMEIGRNIVQGLWDGVSSLWGSFTDWIETKFTNLLSNLSWANIYKVITGQMSVADLFGGSGGSSVPYDKGATEDFPYPGGTTGSGVLSGAGCITNNFYGPVYVGSMQELYDCPSPHPLMTASSQSLLTATVQP